MLTEKDKIFLEKLKKLLSSKDLSVELRPANPSRMVLKGSYGEKIHKTFGITRQGVRWRFQHIFGKLYTDIVPIILSFQLMVSFLGIYGESGCLINPINSCIGGLVDENIPQAATKGMTSN